MIDWLQLFVMARFGRPLLLLFALSGGLWIVGRGLRLHVTAKVIAERAARTFSLMTAILALIAFLYIATWYANDRRYYDFAEPTMPAVAWMFEAGKPLYPPPDAPEQYAHIYGPMAFIPLASAMRIFGADLRVTKSVGAGAAIVAVLLLFAILRSRVGTRLAVLFTGYCALLMLVFRNAAFWVRPDSLELLCTVIGLWAVLHRWRMNWLVLGVSAGVLWNLKFTGPVYSLPLFVLFLERTNRRLVVLAIVAATIGLVVPFVAFPNISFHDYRTWILLSGSKGIVWPTLRQNLEWTLYLVAPLISLIAVSVRQQPLTVLAPRVAISLAVALGLIALLASKPGAGPYHLLPFFPLIVFFTALQFHHVRIESGGILLLGFSFTAVAVLIAAAQQTSFISTVREIDAIGPITEVRRFLDQHPDGVTQMGYSSDERMTFVRPLVVFRSGMYVLDQPAIQEHQLAGIEISEATIAALRSCGVTYWLIPKGGDPFSAINRYPMTRGRALYGEGFRRAFVDSYHKSESLEYFDVWTCARNPNAAER